MLPAGQFLVVQLSAIGDVVEMCVACVNKLVTAELKADVARLPTMDDDVPTGLCEGGVATVMADALLDE